MRTIICAMLLSTVTLCAETVSVPVGKSISEAMVRVRSGDTILLAEGEYKESIIIRDKITVIGAGIQKTVIRGDGRTSVVILNGSSSIENLTVTEGQNGVQTQSPNAKISQVLITGNRGSGILAVKAFPEISQSVISHNGGNGIQATMIGGGALLLDSVTVAENSGYGIDYDGTVPLSVTNSLVYKNGLNAFRDKETQIVASKNAIIPEQKEYASTNRTGKPQFVKEDKTLYTQTPTSPLFGTGATIR